MMAKKPEDYRVARGEGQKLLKKQLQERAGKKIGLPSKENVKNLADAAILMGSLVAPEIGAAVKGVRVAKTIKAAIAKKTPYVKVTTGTQAKNANIMLKSPGSKKAGSPKPGTKLRLQKVVNPRQGEAGQISAAKIRASKAAKVGLKPTASIVTGYQIRKEQDKKK